MSSLVSYAMLLLQNLPVLVRAGVDIEEMAVAVHADVAAMLSEGRGPTEAEWHDLNVHLGGLITDATTVGSTVTGALQQPEATISGGDAVQTGITAADAVVKEFLDPEDQAKADEAASAADAAEAVVAAGLKAWEGDKADEAAMAAKAAAAIGTAAYDSWAAQPADPKAVPGS